MPAAPTDDQTVVIEGWDDCRTPAVFTSFINGDDNKLQTRSCARVPMYKAVGGIFSYSCIFLPRYINIHTRLYLAGQREGVCVLRLRNGSEGKSKRARKRVKERKREREGKEKNVKRRN